MPPQQQPPTIQILSGNKFTSNGPSSRSLVNKAHASMKDVLADQPGVSLEVASNNEYFENDPKCLELLIQLLQQQRAGGRGELGQPQHHQPDGMGYPAGDNLSFGSPPNLFIPPHGQYGNGVSHPPINELLPRLLQQQGAGGRGELGHPQHHQPDGMGHPAGGNLSFGSSPNFFTPSHGQYGNDASHSLINEPHTALSQQAQPNN